MEGNVANVAIAKIVTSTKRFISELQVAQKLSFLQLHDHALRSACRTLLRHIQVVPSHNCVDVVVFGTVAALCAIDSAAATTDVKI